MNKSKAQLIYYGMIVKEKNMEINLNQKDKKQLLNLIDISNNNIQASEMMFYLLQHIDDFTLENIKRYQNDFHLSEKEAFFHLATDILQLSIDDEDNISFLNTYLKDAFYPQDIHKYQTNPYYQNIVFQSHQDKDYALIFDHYHPYEIFPLEDISYLENNVEQTKFGYFEKDFIFPCLNLNQTTWMSITPNEINTMQSDIEKVKGDILILGLGLGYFPYMASLKKEAKSLTIIEKDQKIIDMFKKEIFPQFPYQNKIQIIHDDALNYLKNNTIKYDYIYVDLWHNPEDGLSLYQQIKRLENIHKGSVFLYWLEKGIIAYIKRLVIVLLEESIHGLKDQHYLKAKNEQDKIINDLYFKTKFLHLSTYQDVLNLIKEDRLKELIKE